MFGDLTINDIELSVRTSNRLVGMGITDLPTLWREYQAGRVKVKDVGVRGVKELAEVMEFIIDYVNTPPSIPKSEKRDMLWRKIITHTASPDPVTGCWIWQKGTSGAGRGGGYGRVYYDGQMVAVHRAVYLIVNGYAHKRQHIDHTCENRLCVNPDHLEAVSASENQRRIHIRKRTKNEKSTKN